jgi:hypothetical protein
MSETSPPNRPDPEEHTPRAADVTSPGEPLSAGRDAAPSSSFTDTGEGGTAAGDPLAGTGTPDSEPVVPDGADEV